MKLSQFDYLLPDSLIASHPPSTREGSRLMVVDRSNGKIEHRQFSEIDLYLKPTDLLIFNNSKVIPSRLNSRNDEFEVLLIEESSPNHWITLMRPGRKAPIGKVIDFDPHPPFQQKGVNPIQAEVLRVLPQGERVLRFFGNLDLAAFGEIPLPPYILKKRESESTPRIEKEDDERYQTVYAKNPGSVAAPTAGLHFTPERIARFPHAFVTLHVGIGTFRPVKTENIESHVMHEEYFEIPEDLQNKVENAKRVIAVGTTSARVLESAATLQAQTGRTNIFIYPPYSFQKVDALITNFHLPKSTLLMLVSAFGGIDLIRRAYEEGIREKYRFFSYGDAMLIL